MKNVYILLTKSPTICSKMIHMASGSEFTHAAISLDNKFDVLYSFARKYKHTMLPAGFVQESIYAGIMGDSEDMKCAVYKLTVSDKVYRRLKRILRHMKANETCYRYNIRGLYMCFFNKKYDRKGYFFCSQFVYHALSKAGAIEKNTEACLVRPMDFCELPEAQEIFRGQIRQLRVSDLTA